MAEIKAKSLFKMFKIDWISSFQCYGENWEHSPGN